MNLAFPFSRASAFVVVLALTLVFASGVIAADITSYYPLRVGNAWSYATASHTTVVAGFDVQESEKLGTMEQRVVGPSRFSTKELKVFAVDTTIEERGSGVAPAVKVDTTLHLSTSPSAIELHAVDLAGGTGAKLAKPVSILHDPPLREATTSALGALTVTVAFKSRAVESISVAAGKFPKALKTISEGPVSGELSGLPVHSGTITETSWFVRNVGLVKQERILDVALRTTDGNEVRLKEKTERELRKFSSTKAN
ncbi:MAG: hypothetical protein WCE62_12095 [Polyangiales bacterium]